MNRATNLNAVYALAVVNGVAYVAYKYAKSAAPREGLNNLVEHPMMAAYEGLSVGAYSCIGAFITSNIFGDNKITNGSMSFTLGISTAWYLANACNELFTSKKKPNTQ